MFFQMADILVIYAFLPLLPVWLSLEPSYMAQLSIYTGVTYAGEITQLWPLFLKIQIFKKSHILHFLN